MKKNWIFVAAIAVFAYLVPQSTHAEYGKGDHVISASFGGAMGVNEVDEVKGVGPSGGAAYRYYLFDAFSLGADVALDNYGDDFSEENEADVDVRLLSTSLVGRLDFWPRNEVASYFALGAGSQYLERKYHDRAGTRTETTGRAGYFLALGFEAPLKGKWMWGAELRSTDPLGVSADALGLKLSLARRFGKDRVLAKPEEF